MITDLVINSSIFTFMFPPESGRGQFADTWIEMEPLPRGGGYEFADKIVGGAIPKTYIPAVDKGIQEAMEKGAIAGYPMVDVKVARVFHFSVVELNEARAGGGRRG